MLTPLDIHNKEFKKGLRGYDIDEVDEFLDEVIKDFEGLYKENLELKEKLQKQQDKITQYKEMEETLQNTMVMVQKMAEEASRNAEKEAELIIWEARKKSEQIVSGAQDQVTDNIRRIERLQAFEKQLVIKLEVFLKTHLELIRNSEMGNLTMEIEKDKEEVIKEYYSDGTLECNGD